MFQYGRIKGEWRVWFLDGESRDFMGCFQNEEMARIVAKAMSETFRMISGGKWGRGEDQD